MKKKVGNQTKRKRFEQRNGIHGGLGGQCGVILQNVQGGSFIMVYRLFLGMI